ncbi:MAG: serine hydrolase [Bacteroidetes bacterium]|nr:MAG: serine hydrolase [Bacteroidota bacterium]TAF94112.1 MAG: serine hydrolase [Bacteroidota bacterium]
MKRSLILTVIQLFSLNLFSQDYSPQIDSLLNAYRTLNKFNGTILVYKNGKTTYHKRLGYKDKNKNILLNKNNIFPIGSLTKPFTSILILKLIEQKLISLDDKINKFIPEYPRGSEITIQNLLTHTSGIYEELRNSKYLQQLYSKKTFNHDEKMSFFINEPLDFDPGSKFSYCNSGYTLLGIIIEKITGVSYSQNLKKYIFKPLKMNNTGFDYRRIKKGRVTGYSYLSNSKNIEVEIPNADLLFSSGALYSNLKDLQKFYRGLKLGTIISDRALKQSISIFEQGYGLGWYIDKIGNDSVVNHGGNLEGFTSYFAMNLNKDICVILLSNTTSTSLERIGNSIYKIITNQPYILPKPKQEIILSEETISIYTGEYKVSDSYIVKVTLEDGKLFFQTNNEQKNRILAEKESHFFIIDEDIEIEFIKTNGKVREIKIKQGLSIKFGDKIN